MTRRRQPPPVHQPGDLSPIGTQPMGDDRILCLECGRWYQALTRHIVVHDLDVTEYRRRHGLRIHHPLIAPAVSRRRSAHSTALAQRPDVAASLSRAMAARVEARRSGKATQAARRTRADWLRPQTRADMAQRTADRNRAAGETTVRRIAAYARARGYPDPRAYFAAGEPDRIIADALGMTRGRISAIRIEMTGERRPAGGIPAPVVAAPPRVRATVVCERCGAIVIPAATGRPPRYCPACAAAQTREADRLRPPRPARKASP